MMTSGSIPGMSACDQVKQSALYLRKSMILFRVFAGSFKLMFTCSRYRRPPEGLHLAVLLWVPHCGGLIADYLVGVIASFFLLA